MPDLFPGLRLVSTPGAGPGPAPVGSVLRTKFSGLSWVMVEDFGASKDWRLNGTDSLTGQVFSASSPQLWGSSWGPASLTLQKITGVGRHPGVTPDMLFTRTFETVNGLTCLGITRNYDPYVGVDQAAFRLKTAAPFAAQSMSVARGKLKIPAGVSISSGSFLVLQETKFNYGDKKIELSILREGGQWFLKASCVRGGSGGRPWGNGNTAPYVGSSPPQSSTFGNDNEFNYYRTIADPRGNWITWEVACRPKDAAGTVAGGQADGWWWASVGFGTATVPVAFGSCTQQFYIVGQNMADGASPGVTIIFPFNHYTDFNCTGLPFYYTDIEVWDTWPSDSSPRPAEPAFPPGTPVVLSVASAGTTSISYTVTAAPANGRNVVAYQVDRSLNGVTGWTPLTMPGRARVQEIPPPSTKTPTKYVHPSGTFNGFSAFTTIQAALNVSVAGDEIAVAPGTYTEKALFTRSGSLPNPIRVRAFNPNNRPVIDATNLSTNWVFEDLGSNAIVSMNASHIIWDGIDVINVRNQNVLSDWGGGLAFKLGACRNNGSFIFGYDQTTWYNGIRVYRSNISNCGGAFQTLMCDDYTIGGCDISGAQKGRTWEISTGNPPITWGAAVGFNGRNGKFLDNIVRQTMGEGLHIGIHIPMVEGANPALGMGHKDFVVRGNQFYDTFSGPVYLTVASGGVIEENLVFMSNDPRFWYSRNVATGYPQSAFGFGTELGQFGNPVNVHDQAWSGIENVVIRNNIITGGLSVFNIISYNPNQAINGYRNVDIEHNTIFAPSGAYPDLYQAINNGATIAQYNMAGFRFRNNTVLVSDAAHLSRQWQPLGAGKVVQGNLFSHTPPSDLSAATNVIDAGATVINNKAYNATSTGYPNLVSFDLTRAMPFLNAPVISPLVDRSASIGTLRDYFGNTRPTATGRADIGAISLAMGNTIAGIDSGLTPATTYFYRARFIDTLGDTSPYSAVQSVATLAVNMPPAWTGAPAPSAVFGGVAAVSLSSVCVDPEGDPITFTLETGALPTGWTINNVTRALNYNGSGVIGTTTGLSLRATATGGFAISAVFSITVSPVSSQPLVQSSNLTYLGSFKPPEMFPAAGYEYAAGGLAYDAAGNGGQGSLFAISSSGWRAGEIGTATPVISTNYNALNFGASLQAPADIDGGQFDLSGNRLSGLLIHNGALYAAAATGYETFTPNNKITHLRRSKTLVGNTATGSASVRPNSGIYSNPRLTSGYMCHIPAEWQSLLGGPCITGYVAPSIVSNASDGPAAFAFDPAQITTTGQILNAQVLIAYVEQSLANPPMGRSQYDPGASPVDVGPIDSASPFYRSGGTVWNWTGLITGCCIPSGTRSLLFLGKLGTGHYWYDQGGGSNPFNGFPWGYDPTDGSKGEHAWPYRYQIWAYDLNDLAAVRAGTIAANAVQPYAIWQLQVPFEGNSAAIRPDPLPDDHTINGVAYDPSRRRIYWSTYYGGSFGRGQIHVHEVNNAEVR